MRTIARLAERTPADRDRVVDAVRAASIVVVIVWHWALSINHRDDDGRLVNPNPIADVPFGWSATWLLQVMPLFFIVGGFANRAGWCSTVERGGGTIDFLRARARRLLAPVAAFVGAWAVVEGVAFMFVDDHRPVLDHAVIVFMPLWFVGAYLWVVALTPITAAVHGRRPVGTVAALAAAVAVTDVVRFGLGIDDARWLNVALVWILIHQLGYFWGDGTLTGWSTRRLLALAGCGASGLIALTSLGAYPRSMVATTDTEISHMYPPTAVIAVLAVTQLGLIVAARPWLDRRLRHRRPWTAVVAVNAVIMTIFVWHMTALLIVITAFESLGGTLGSDATAQWWLARPLWIIVPALALAPLTAVFSRVETRPAAT